MALVKASLASFIRPADTTAYAANDVVANSTTAGVALQFPYERGVLNRVIVAKTSNTVSNSIMNLYLFSQDPGVLTDNAAFAHGVDTNLLGIVALGIFAIPTGTPVAYAISDTAITSPIVIDFADQYKTGQVSGSGAYPSVYGVLVATAAYAPASAEQFSVQLHVSPDTP